MQLIPTLCPAVPGNFLRKPAGGLGIIHGNGWPPDPQSGGRDNTPYRHISNKYKNMFPLRRIGGIVY